MFGVAKAHRNVQGKRIIKKVIRMMSTADDHDRVRQFYELKPPSLEFANRTTTYMNMGYWADDCTSQDSAAEALANLLADAAGFQPGDTVLDAGFGYGDQDFAWLRDRQLKSISGINITPHHVTAAQRRAKGEGLAGRLDFREGSATSIPFGTDTFDHVVALESAFHFYPRSAFFREAHRVLRSGGTIALADIIPLDGGTLRMGFASVQLSWIKFSVGDENWHDRDAYAHELAAAGFSDVRIVSVRDNVYEPWRKFMTRRSEDPAIRPLIGGALRLDAQNPWGEHSLVQRELALLDYVIAAARKP